MIKIGDKILSTSILYEGIGTVTGYDKKQYYIKECKFSISGVPPNEKSNELYVKPNFVEKFKDIKLRKSRKLEITAEEFFRKPFKDNIPLVDIQTDGKDVVACMVDFALSDIVKQYYLNNK